MRRIAVHFRPDEPHQNKPAVSAGRLGIVKLAASLLESANRRHSDGSALASRPVEAPLARFLVIEAQRCSLDMALGAVHFELLDLRPAVPDLARDGGAVELHPLRRTRQWIFESLEVNLPAAQLEIETALPIPIRCHLERAAC